MRMLILLSVFLFAGCGGSDDNSTVAEDVEEAEDVLGESFHDSMDAAEEVEQELMKSKEDMDAALEEAEGGSEG